MQNAECVMPTAAAHAYATSNSTGMCGESLCITRVQVAARHSSENTFTTTMSPAKTVAYHQISSVMGDPGVSSKPLAI